MVDDKMDWTYFLNLKFYLRGCFRGRLLCHHLRVPSRVHVNYAWYFGGIRKPRIIIFIARNRLDVRGHRVVVIVVVERHFGRRIFRRRAETVKDNFPDKSASHPAYNFATIHSGYFKGLNKPLRVKSIKFSILNTSTHPIDTKSAVLCASFVHGM